MMLISVLALSLATRSAPAASTFKIPPALVALRVLSTIDPAAVQASQSMPARTHGLIDLWAQGKPAFGVYAPNENSGPQGQGPRPAVYTREGGEKLAMNPLYDYVFLNLEGRYTERRSRRWPTVFAARMR